MPFNEDIYTIQVVAYGRNFFSLAHKLVVLFDRHGIFLRDTILRGKFDEGILHRRVRCAMRSVISCMRIALNAT